MSKVFTGWGFALSLPGRALAALWRRGLCLLYLSQDRSVTQMCPANLAELALSDHCEGMRRWLEGGLGSNSSQVTSEKSHLIPEPEYSQYLMVGRIR